MRISKQMKGRAYSESERSERDKSVYFWSRGKYSLYTAITTRENSKKTRHFFHFAAAAILFILTVALSQLMRTPNFPGARKQKSFVTIPLNISLVPFFHTQNSNHVLIDLEIPKRVFNCYGLFIFADFYTYYLP